MFLWDVRRFRLLAVGPFTEEAAEKEKTDLTACKGGSGSAETEISEPCLYRPDDCRRSDGFPAWNKSVGCLFKVYGPEASCSGLSAGNHLPDCDRSRNGSSEPVFLSVPVPARRFLYGSADFADSHASEGYP